MSHEEEHEDRKNERAQPRDQLARRVLAAEEAHLLLDVPPAPLWIGNDLAKLPLGPANYGSVDKSVLDKRLHAWLQQGSTWKPPKDNSHSW